MSQLLSDLGYPRHPTTGRKLGGPSKKDRKKSQDVRDSWNKPARKKKPKRPSLSKPQIPRLTAPGYVTSWSSAGSGGGGGGAAFAPPPQPILPDFSAVNAALASAQDSAVNALASLESSFQRDLDMLRSAYQLAETPEEKAQLQWQLDNLKAQRVAGEKVIKTSFQEAIRDNKRTASEIRAQGTEQADRSADRFSDAAAQAAELVTQQQAEYENTALGLDAGGVEGGAADIIAAMQASAPREAAFAEEMAGASAGEIDALRESLRGEQNAQTADLQRLTQQLGASATMAHHQQVNQRIAAERQAMAQALMQLGQQYQGRQWGLQDQLTNLGLQGAQLQQEQSLAGIGPQNQWAQMQWQAQREDAQMAADLQNQQIQQQFQLDAERQARMFEQQMADYLASQQEEDDRQLASRVLQMGPQQLNRYGQAASLLGIDPSIFVRP